MEYRYIGRSGLRVSPICMGTMTFPLAGMIEEIVGRWMQTKSRDSIILASKVVGAASGWFVPFIRHGFTAIDLHLSDEVLKACDAVHDKILYPMG